MKSLSSKLPALLILSAGVAGLFAASAMCNASGETVQQFAPIPQATAAIALGRWEHEAKVTATCMVALANEVVSDTHVTHAIQRDQAQTRFDRSEALESTVTTCKRVLAGFIALGASVTAIGGGVGLGAWLGGRGVASGVRHIATARIPPSRRLEDGLNLVRLPSGEVRAIETRAGGQTWSIDDDASADPAAAECVREFRAVVVRAIAGALSEQPDVRQLLTGGDNERR